MESLFHIDKYGVPSACTSPARCPYRENGHFKTYEDAKERADQIYNEFKRGSPDDKNPIKKIRSYYSDYSAVTEFPINKKIAYMSDFELIIISWMERAKVKEQMKKNMIAGVKFTPGEIVRIVNAEMKKKINRHIDLEEYYNIPKNKWSKETHRQFSQFKNKEKELAKKLNLEKVTMICLPMYARENLAKYGFISTPDNLNEVVYKVSPIGELSEQSELISYNHSMNKITSCFSVFEVVGAVEDVSLYSLTYSESINKKFIKIWQEKELEGKGFSYEAGLNKFAEAHLFKTIQGTDIPKAFAKMSPPVAKELMEYFTTYRSIMLVMRDKLKDANLDFYSKYVSFNNNIEDEGEWMID